MDTTLLTYIRQMLPRMQLGIARGRRRAPRLGLGSDLGLAASTFRWPAFVRRSARIYLPSRAKANSKTAAVVGELTTAGMPREAFLTSEKSAGHALNNLLGGLINLPWTLRFIVILHRRAGRLGELERFLILTREVNRRFLRKHPALIPLIISDVSPDRHALWSAAVAERRQVVWWQDDHHHTEELSYPVGAAAVISAEGYRNVLAKAPSALVAARPPMKPAPFKAIPESPRVGIATNSFFKASPAERRQLAQIRASLAASTLYLRLHPNSKVQPSDIPEAWIRIASPLETLDEFIDKIDIAVVGNSTVQLKLLCSGLPVVHFPFDDPRGFDKHGYHAMGFTCGSAQAETLSLADAQRHYAAPDLSGRIVAYVSIPAEETLHNLTELARYLSRSPIQRSP